MGVFGGHWKYPACFDPLVESGFVASRDRTRFETVPGGPCFIAEHAVQTAKEGGLHLVGSLRLDDRRDLATRLGVHQREAVSDALLIVRAWQRWALATPAYLAGDFAFAIWDESAGQLILVRDGLGQRPLHYVRRGAGIAFASHPLPLARLTGTPRANLNQLSRFLAVRDEVGSSSFWAGVNRLVPGHALIVTNHLSRIARFWPPDLSPIQIGYADAATEARDLLDQAVRGAMAQPITVSQLSGGLDSSLVIESAARVRSGGQRLVAVTGYASDPDPIGLDRPFDEREAAAATAQRVGVPHRAVGAQAQSPLLSLAQLLPYAQRPVLNACNLGWLDATCEAARDEGASVLLHGLMGNFTLTHEGTARLPALARYGHLVALVREMRAFRRNSGAHWSGTLALAFGWAIPGGIYRAMARARGVYPPSVEDSIFLRFEHPAAARLLEEPAEDGRIMPDDGPRPILAELAFVDMGLLNSAVEQRFGLTQVDPLASRRLVEFALRLPSDHYFRGGLPRRLARDMLRGRVPDRVIDERKRGYQGANWRRGIEGALEEIIAEVDLASSDADAAALFDLPRIRARLLAWPSAGWDQESQVQTYRRDLMRSVCALRWLRFVRGA